LFFLAFFPQFAQLEQPGYKLRIGILALIFMGVSYLVFMAMAWVSAYGSQKQISNPRYKSTMDWLSMLVFVGLALWLFFDRVWVNVLH
jgi:threonine/homoserine/homoserine lactone efflux protein